MKYLVRLAWVASCVAGCGGAVQVDGGTADAGVLDASSAFDADALDASLGDAGRRRDLGVDAALDAAPPDPGPRGDDLDLAARPDGGALLEALTRCAPAGDVCAAGPASGIAAGYRKDAWLRDYEEETPVPADGGRVQIATRSAVTGRITRVTVDGVDLASITQPPAAGAPVLFEWWHAWPRDLRAGEPVWVAFHARSARWDTGAASELVIETDRGEAVRGMFVARSTPAPLTYVTTSEDLRTVLVHVKNSDSSPHTITRVLVNGADVTSAACLADRRLDPGEPTLLTVPTCAALGVGGAWTVVVEYDDAPPAVGVGRVLRPSFPIEAWNNTPECPFPGGNAANYDAMRAAYFDAMYVHGGVCQRCGCDTATLLGTTLPATDGWQAFVESGAIEGLGARRLASTAGLAAFQTGDESDGSIYASDGRPNADSKARRSLAHWLAYPDVPTFNGGKTNRNIGTFAGMADVQGMDLYVAACAPHITPFGMHPPLRGAYDYLRNTRDNHMPGPTWLYTQGLAPTWNRDLGASTLHIQPDPQELAVQWMSALAAGAKGLLWFQSNAEERDHAPARWAAISQANHITRGVRSLLREGDVTGLGRGPDGTIVEVVRARDALVVMLISLVTEKTVDDLECLQITGSESSVPHWTFREFAPNVQVTVPEDLAVRDLFEVTDAGPIDAPRAGGRIGARTLVLRDLATSTARPVRIFVLASDAGVRARVAAAMMAR